LDLQYSITNTIFGTITIIIVLIIKSASGAIFTKVNKPAHAIYVIVKNNTYFII